MSELSSEQAKRLKVTSNLLSLLKKLDIIKERVETPRFWGFVLSYKPTL